MPDHHIVIDLYAGPGGWDVAASDLGLHPVGWELDGATCATRGAAGHLTVRQDVASAWVPPHDGLIASPPCQAFSLAGDRKGVDDLGRIIRWVVACADGWVEDPTDGAWNDERSKHILQPLRWAWHGRPRWVALEQVPPCIDLWEAVLAVLQGWGYRGWTAVLNAADYGVPQTRRRAILVAHRDRMPDRPEVTHVDPRKGDSLFHLPWVSMADTLGWAGEVRRDSGPGAERDPRSTEEPSYTIRAGASGSAPGGITRVLDRRTNSKGPAGTMVPTALVGLDRAAPTVTSKSEGQWVLRNNNQERACVRPVDQPAGTIFVGNNLNSIEWVPRQDAAGSVKVTIPELAVLQGFPADYHFSGSKTAQATQVGNAIPPGLAHAVLRTVVA